MNAVNNGPAFTENEDQNGTNLPDFKAANIPYARVHDASICYDYGGEHTVDVLSIFPDFNADENDPDSYDFTLTDDYLSHIMLVLICSHYNLLSPVIVAAFFKKRSVYHHDREQRIVPSDSFVKVFVARIEFFDR